MKMYFLEYVGNATVDKRLSNPMIPWVIAQIHRGGHKKNVGVTVENGVLSAYPSDVGVGPEGKPLFSHQLQLVSRLTMNTSDQVTMFYAVRHSDNQLLTCHLYQSADPEQVMEVMNQMRDQSAKLQSSQNQSSQGVCKSSSTTALCPDISPSSSQFFEVLYIGKIKVSHKKVPDSFIDDALDKFNNLDKLRRQHEFNYSQDNEDDVIVSNGSSKFGSSEALKDTSSNLPDHIPESIPGRKRSGSAGSVLLIKRPETLSIAANAASNQDDRNRTMVFHVGRADLRLISPDRKQVLLHKLIKDIVNCLQGIKHGSHFAFVCREAGIEQPHYIGYVFKCQSPSVAGDVVTAITQALGCGKKENGKPNGSPIMSCEHCPLVWYHKLCHELETLGSDISAQVEAVMKRVEMLPEEEQVVVETKLQGAAALEPSTSRERLELLMMLLRAHCESKQSTHVHDTPQNRHEFLNHYLGGGTIFMKAKRSLTNSFDQLLKRKGSRDDLGPMLKVLSLPPNSTICKDDIHLCTQTDPAEVVDSEEKSGPMKNIFMKVGHSPTGSSSNSFSFKGDDDCEDFHRPGSWRQAIFNTVVTPSKAALETVVKRDKEYFRCLWKKAINQQVLLIRMEKENAKLTARQEEANVKRIKLEYDDLGCTDNSQIWDKVISQDPTVTNDRNILLQALKQGVPKTKRGEVWIALADKFSSQSPPIDESVFPNYNIPYESLLKQLTSHQHAILIDLGRTFPSHKYFSSPLGPGQLALFNLLKAYSLLDPEVGYCQGLSFIAATLLLHMTESESFYLLKQLMLVRGLRKRYLPDMSALQVHLYQLSRLLLDCHPDLYKHLDKYDVGPTLYAAPWFLTLFSSQFPLGFVTRVFDAMIIDSPDVLFKVAVTLLGEHKNNLLNCDSFELIMDYLKKELPKIEQNMMNKIMEQVLSRDVSKELTEYGVEYHVLQEEMSTPRPETKKVKQLEAANQSLLDQNKALTEQLQIANSNINRLESSRSAYLGQINKLESQVKSLEVTISILGDFISSVTYGNSDIEVPGDIVRILTQLSRKEANGPKRILRSAPLRVIEDNHQPKVLKETVSSNNLSSRVSGLFRNNSVSTDQSENKVGRILTDKEKEGLLSRIRGSEERRQHNYIKPPLKSSQSSFELTTKQTQLEPKNNNSLPLESNGVHVSFEGTTKLKTLHPLRSRNSVTLFHPTEQKQLELKIIEKEDKISDKIKATMNKVTNLFESENNGIKTSEKFVNSLNKEAPLFIESQNSIKKEVFQ